MVLFGVKDPAPPLQMPTSCVAGKHEGGGIDSNIFMGCDVLQALTLAHAELGIGKD